MIKYFENFFSIYKLKILVNIPIGMISEMKKIGRQTRSKNDSALYGIEITSKVIEYILVFSYRTLIDID